MDLLRVKLNPPFLTPKRYEEQPAFFCKGVPSGVISKCQNMAVWKKYYETVIIEIYCFICTNLHSWICTRSLQLCIHFIFINQSTQSHSNTMFSSIFTKVHNITLTIWCLDCLSRINTYIGGPGFASMSLHRFSVAHWPFVARILVHTWWCTKI